MLADICADVYTLESACLRAEKLGGRATPENSALAVDMASVYASDAADRISLNAKTLAAALGIDPLAGFLPAIDTIVARRRIADAVIEAGRYLW